MPGHSKGGSASETEATLALILTPRSAVNALMGWQGTELKVRVTAPPVDGAANQALLKFLADQLGLAKENLRLVKGQAGRRKLVTVRGLNETDLRERLQEALAKKENRS